MRSGGGLGQPRARGFSVVELMVAMALGLILVGAVLASYLALWNSTRQQRALREMSEGAQLALSLIRRDLMQAGYVHPTSVSGDRFSPLASPAQGHPVFACPKGFTAADAPAAAGVCNLSGSEGEAIEINFEATRQTALQTSSGFLADCVGNALAASTGQAQSAPADEATRILSSHRYFVMASGGGTPVALACASPVSAAERLVPGVELLSLRFGVAPAWDAGDPSTRRPARYVRTQDMNPTDWAGVVAVRICVQMVSLAAVLPGDEVSTAHYLNCMEQWETATDGRLRRTYTTTLGLRNRGGMQ
jgi:type IV pilus assembly protein PilW